MSVRITSEYCSHWGVMKPPLLTGSSRPRGSKPKSLQHKNSTKQEQGEPGATIHSQWVKLLHTPTLILPCRWQILPVSRLLLPSQLLISAANSFSAAGSPGQAAIQILQGGLAGEVELVLAAVHLGDGLLLFGTAKHNPAAACSAGTASGLCGLHTQQKQAPLAACCTPYTTLLRQNCRAKTYQVGGAQHH